MAEWQRTVGRRYKAGSPPKFESPVSFFWLKYVGHTSDPVVVLEFVPWPMKTSSSQWRSAFGMMLGIQTRKSYEFRDDISRVEVTVDGEPVVPYISLRVPYREFFETQEFSLNDMAFGAVPQLDLLVFGPGKRVEVKVWKDDREKPDEFVVPEWLLKEVWDPFEAWYQRLPEEQKSPARKKAS